MSAASVARASGLYRLTLLSDFCCVTRSDYSRAQRDACDVALKP